MSVSSLAAQNAPLDFSALRSIAVFRALQLGDLLCVVPALRALRAAAPQARITLIGLPWASSFVARFDRYVDENLVFPGFPGLPESVPQLSALPAFFASAHARQFDLAIQLHGSGAQTNPLMVALGAKRNAGFFMPGQFCPDPALFTSWSEEEHEVLRYVRLMTFLGAKAQGTQLEFPFTAADYESLAKSCPVLPPASSYVCIHPGARLPSRRWPPARFAQVADGLAAQGLQVVLTGSEEERDIISSVRDAMHAPALDMCGRTELGALAALVANARLVVCNDTGISHIAAGVATPSVVVCSGADPKRWAPLDGQRHRLLFADAPCRPCAHLTCPIGHPCALDVGADQVLAQALAMCSTELPPPAYNAGLQMHPRASATPIKFSRLQGS
jgi:ADP-heptose:LPS heptosyltransferase